MTTTATRPLLTTRRGRLVVRGTGLSLGALRHEYTRQAAWLDSTPDLPINCLLKPDTPAGVIRSVNREYRYVIPGSEAEAVACHQAIVAAIAQRASTRWYARRLAAAGGAGTPTCAGRPGRL